MPVSVLIVRAALLARLAGPAPAPVAPYPFAVGETLSYDAKLGYFPIGSATASVGRAREQGADAFVFAFAGAGGPPGVRVQYELTSWTRSTRFASLRFHRKMVQGNSVEEQRYQITTLHPTTYREARTIGEHYRDGVPVIINLTEMEEADARRLVDFAAGLAFGLRGTMERVTNRVFLLSPANVQVTAEDKAKIAEGGFFSLS